MVSGQLQYFQNGQPVKTHSLTIMGKHTITTVMGIGFMAQPLFGTTGGMLILIPERKLKMVMRPLTRIPIITVPTVARYMVHN